MQFPHTRLRAWFHPNTATGKLKAVMIPTTPTGFHCSIRTWPGPTGQQKHDTTLSYRILLSTVLQDTKLTILHDTELTILHDIELTAIQDSELTVLQVTELTVLKDTEIDCPRYYDQACKLD